MDEKLDRTIANPELFPRACVLNELTATSDHTTLFLDLGERQKHKGFRFQFENAWAKEICREVIANGWGSSVGSDVNQRLAACSLELPEWSKG